MNTTNTEDSLLLRNRVIESGGPLLRIAARKIGYDKGIEGRFTLLAVRDILYLFTSGALSPKRTVIDAKWNTAKLFSPGRVYLRTAQGLFVTRYRSLAKILARLEPGTFHSVQKSLVINVLKVSEIAFSTKLKQVGMVANGTVEWLNVSRRKRTLQHLRTALGIEPT